MNPAAPSRIAQRQRVLYDGNLLAAIFYLLYFLALLVYYPVLVLVALVKRVRTPR